MAQKMLKWNGRLSDEDRRIYRGHPHGALCSVGGNDMLSWDGLYETDGNLMV